MKKIIILIISLIILLLFVACGTAQKVMCPTQTLNQFVLHHAKTNCNVRNPDTSFMQDFVRCTYKYVPKVGDVVKFKRGDIGIILTKPELRHGRAGQTIMERTGDPTKNGGEWRNWWYFKIAMQAKNCGTTIAHTNADAQPKFFTRLSNF